MAMVAHPSGWTGLGPALKPVLALPASRPSAFAKQAFVPTRGYAKLCTSCARVIVLVAPPGYGKTTLLRRYGDELQRRNKRVGYRALSDCLPLPQGRGCEDVVIIDDAHLDNHRLVAAWLQSAVDSVGSRSPQFLLALRALPDLDWLSLTADGSLCLLRVEDLTLDQNETREILSQIAGFTPEPSTLAAICSWAEGWPMAVRYRGQLALRRGSFGDDAQVDCGFGSDLHRFIDRTMLSRLDGPMVQFLTALCDLDPFTAPMIAGCLGLSATPLLERALNENLMLLPQAAGHRVHPVLRAILEARRLRDGGCADPAVLHRAGEWCASNGSLPRAIEFFLRAGSERSARTCLDQHLGKLCEDSGEVPRLPGWVSGLPLEDGNEAVELRLWRIWALVLRLDLASARAELAQLAVTMQADAPLQSCSHYERLQISIAALAGDADAVIDKAAAWLERWGDTYHFHAAAVTTLKCLSHHHRGESTMSRRDLATAYRHARGQGRHYAHTWIMAVEALLAFDAGRVHYAVNLAESAMASARDAHVAQSMVGLLTTLAARLHAESGDIETARIYLDRSRAEALPYGIVETQIARLEAVVLVAETRHGVDAALVEIRRSMVPGERFAEWSGLIATRLLMRNGRVGEAGRVFETECAGALHDDRPPSLRWEAMATKAWLLHARGDSEEAQALGRSILASLDAAGWLRRELDLHFLFAATHAALDDRRAARSSLNRALRLTTECGLRQSALNHAWAIAPLLTPADDEAAPTACISAMLSALRVRAGMDAEVTAVGVSEPLTPRELEVLHHLDSGLTSESLARRIELSQSTLKWHIKNIYAKLGVHNRSGALRRARQLALLGQGERLS